MSQKNKYTVKYVEVDANHVGQRLDNFLFTHLKGVPKSHIYRILRTGQVRVNKGRVKPHYKLVFADVIRIPPLHIAQNKEQISSGEARYLAEQILQAVVYEDGDLIVLNKPSGLAVHGGSGLKHGLIEILKTSPNYTNLELVHRLDRATSGCLVLAKRRAVLQSMHQLLQQNAVKKIYCALLQGRLKQAQKVTESLAKAGARGGERFVMVSEQGKHAETEITPIQVYAMSTLVKVQINTGRTHQIRVHCQSIGHAIAGDDKYGSDDFNQLLRKQGLNRLFLHAQQIEFQLEKKYSVSAPLPDELNSVLERISAT